jgi:hypothetical protein
VVDPDPDEVKPRLESLACMANGVLAAKETTRNEGDVVE